MSGKLGSLYSVKQIDASTRRAYAMCKITGRRVEWRGQKAGSGPLPKDPWIELDNQVSSNVSALQEMKAKLSRLMNANYHS